MSAGASVRMSFLLLVAMYTAAMLWVWTGAIYRDINLLPMAGLHLGSAAASAGILWIVLSRVPALPSFDLAVPVGPIFAAAIVAGAIAHWISLGGIPIVDALLTDNYLTAGLIRDGITREQNVFFNYMPTFIIKVFAPFLVIYCIDKRRWKLGIFVLLFGSFYAISLMQKSYPLYVTAPPALFALLTWRPVKAVFSGAVGVAAVVALVMATNPALRTAHVTPNETKIVEPAAAPPVAEHHPLEMVASPTQALKAAAPDIIDSLAVRVVVSPGMVVSQWFDVFPSVLPFNGLCGYRFLAPLAGCAHVENAKNVWLHYNPDLIALGYQGSMGAAHFMEEYANFGAAGLAISALLLVGVLAVVSVLSAHVGLAGMVALNFAFIMALSSTGLHTTLLSGGWALMLLCSMLWRPSSGPRAEHLARQV